MPSTLRADPRPASVAAAAPLRVMFASAELAPLARVGGLAAAAAGLVAELRRQSIDVEVVLPDYGGISLTGETSEVIDVPSWAGPASARRGVADGVGEVTLVTVHGIARPHPYVQPGGEGWHDNDRRFLGFAAAIAALCDRRRPDVLHLNDWHTAAASAFLASPPPTVLTIHTLGYQGNTSPGWLHELAHHRDAYEMWGDTNPLAGGIRRADLVVAVSPHYAAEITEPGGGAGLDGLLRDKGERLVGILNGIDDDAWNPATDPYLPAYFDAADPTPKIVTKHALLSRFELADVRGPLFTMVTRLVAQKGVDVTAESLPYLSSVDGAFICLGDGDESLAAQLADAAATQPGRVAFVRGYDEALAHQLFAGGDVFVMPSRFEPCGLAQMQAMRYGAIPLVTDVGGLHDTVADIDATASTGTGIVVPATTSAAVVDGMHRAARAWSNGKRRAAMQRRGMTRDWSWRAPAQQQIDWYRRLIAERAAGSPATTA